MKFSRVIKIVYSLCMYLTSIKCYNEFNNTNNLIETSKCTIPDLPPYSPELTAFVNGDPISCTSLDPLPTYTSIENDEAWLHYRKEVIERYFGPQNNISCCYSYIFRDGSPDWPDVGTVRSNCKKFEEKVKLSSNLVWVSCSESEDFDPMIQGFPWTPIYENIHQVIHIPKYVQIKADRLTKSSSKKPISILVMVIDSVSRLNFIRTMPLTRNFLMENGFYEFKGYNKVDDNTFPNAMAMLTGMNLNDSKRICRPTDINGLNNCPFIWYKFRDIGYATAYAEDWSQIATFNYNKKGFKNIPTDFYFKPYMDAVTLLNTEYHNTMPFCAGPESQGDRILNLAYEFATTLRNKPSFGIFWMNTFSHNYINSPMTMDRNVKNFFENLRTSGVLSESVVLLLSDHGIRYGPIVSTSRGFYELRLPMNYISLPEWFKRAYPEETIKFEENAGKLTSTYDLYMTLQHLLELSGTNFTRRPSLACPNCRSFLEDIPLERSCNDAGIPEKWCTCNRNLTAPDNQ